MIPHALSKKEKKKQRRTKRRLARSLEVFNPTLFVKVDCTLKCIRTQFQCVLSKMFYMFFISIIMRIKAYSGSDRRIFK